MIYVLVMAKETGLPEGFSYHEVPQMRASFVKPDGWFFKYVEIGNTQAAFISLEQITTDTPFNTLDEVEESNRGFRTGFTINAFARIPRPHIAAFLAISTNPAIISEGPIEAINGSPFIIYQGRFHSSLLAQSRGFEPRKFYLESIGNILTHTVYISMFESPELDWDRYEETGRLMMERKVLNPDY